MKKDIILSGVGGQGILSIATVIGQAALKDGLSMKQAEVHEIVSYAYLRAHETGRNRVSCLVRENKNAKTS